MAASQEWIHLHNEKQDDDDETPLFYKSRQPQNYSYDRNEYYNIDYEDYRIGDLFYLFFLSEDFELATLKRQTSSSYPGTIASFYLNSLNDTEPGYGYKNITRLFSAIQQFVNEHDERELQFPSSQELVIHLRLADTMTSPMFANISMSVQEGWDHVGFASPADGIKYNYKREEWMELLERIPNNVTFTKITVVGSDVHGTDEEHRDRNEEYLNLVLDLLRQTYQEINVTSLQTRNPDVALLFMASAEWLIVGNGGFGQIAKACVNQVKPGHGISDVFGGEMVGFDDDRLTKEELDFYNEHYIDTHHYFETQLGRPYPQFLDEYVQTWEENRQEQLKRLREMKNRGDAR